MTKRKNILTQGRDSQEVDPYPDPEELVRPYQRRPEERDCGEN